MTRFLCALGWLSCLGLHAAELQFELDKLPVNQPPPGFRSLLLGGGPPGDWKVILDEVAPALAPLTPQARSTAKRPVIAQLSADSTDERFPLLVYENETFGDFQLTCRFKTVSGRAEQMAGVVFRVQDEMNFYVIRANSLTGTLRFYKVIKGRRTPPFETALKIPTGEWHELRVAYSGNKILAHLGGRQVFALVDDTDLLPPGRIGLWTKSDAVSYFTDIRIHYTPLIPLAQTLINETLKRYDRVVGLRIYSNPPGRSGLEVIASDKPEERGMKAMEAYQDIMAGKSYAYGRTRDTCTVSLPLRDRNGDVAGVVRIEMERFPGQTENNAVARAMPIVKLMEQRVKSRQDLVE